MYSRIRCITLVTLAILRFAGPRTVDAVHAQAADNTARTPVVVELFTSEGCSSCPAADELLRRLMAEQPIEKVQVIALSQHVDYWDRLGWRDRFSSARFTERQNEYARALGNPDNVFTPQMVIDGREQVLGSDFAKLRSAALSSAGNPRATLTVSVARSESGKASVKVSVGEIAAPLASGKLQVLVALVEDGLVTKVGGGENAQRELRHDAVVRTLETIGSIKAGSAPVYFTKEIGLKRDWAPGKLRAVAFLQEEQSRRIVGAAMAPLGS